MRNPFAALTTARRTATSSRAVPALDVLPAAEYLDQPLRRDARPAPPEVSIQGIDPVASSLPVMPAVHLVARDGAPGPRSVTELLAAPEGFVLRRLRVDVRPFRDVLECRGGWNLLAQLVRDPSDRVTNAVFRSAVAAAPDDALGAVLPAGDVDCDVRVVADGDAPAQRCRVDLGRARLSLVALLADSERRTRRLAEVLARPRDRELRRCLERSLAEVLAERPLTELVLPHEAAPQCVVPGTWRMPTSTPEAVRA